jgi:hypothetical protein
MIFWRAYGPYYHRLWSDFMATDLQQLSTSQSPYVTWPQTVPLPQYIAQHKLCLLSRDAADLPATRIVSEGLPLLSETDHAQSKYISECMESVCLFGRNRTMVNVVGSG